MGYVHCLGAPRVSRCCSSFSALGLVMKPSASNSIIATMKALVVQKRGAGVLTAVGVVLGLAEWVTWKASRQVLPAGAVDAGRIEPGESVLVLGCPLPLLHRWRVRIAARSTEPTRAR